MNSSDIDKLISYIDNQNDINNNEMPNNKKKDDSKEDNYIKENSLSDENRIVIGKDNADEQMNISYEDNIIEDVNEDNTSNFTKLIELMDLNDNNISIDNDIKKVDENTNLIEKINLNNIDRKNDKYSDNLVFDRNINKKRKIIL